MQFRKIGESLFKRKEEIHDGFYSVCTVLEDKATAIAKIMKNSWEIEECFQIMKTDFKARPVYLSRKVRIVAYFVTCLISLIIYRLLEKKLNEKYTCYEIVSGLRDMISSKKKVICQSILISPMIYTKHLAFASTTRSSPTKNLKIFLKAQRHHKHY